MYVPREEVLVLDMTVEEGMKLVISGGIVVPPSRPPAIRPSARGEQPDRVVALEQVEQ